MSALQEAGAAVEEGMGLVKNRQKAIRLADRSELGWAVVNEYGEDELAEDSDDEKRIAKAMATAEKKAAQLKKKSGRGVMCRVGRVMCRLGPPAKWSPDTRDLRQHG